MNPLKELSEEYKSLDSEDKSNFLAKHLELVLTSFKKEIVNFDMVPSKQIEEKKDEVLKTSSSELITIPTPILPSIKDELNENSSMEERQETTSVPSERVFEIAEEKKKDREEEQEQSKMRKVVKARKSTKGVSLEEEYLRLMQEKRTHLDLSETPELTDESPVARVSSYTVNRIKNHLKTNYKDNTSKEEIKEIKAIGIADGLTDAEQEKRIEGNIKNMIDDLKREDRGEEIRSSGVRLGGR